MKALVTRTVTTDNGDTWSGTTTTSDWKWLSEDFADRSNFGGTFTWTAPNAFEYLTTGNTRVRYELLSFLTDEEAQHFTA